ncbi:HD family hydrolase [Thermococcus sp.]|uniref:HD domain-containing protein n=1 Tax=Thermococcus sp. TaxID=35749 RepID=UPI00263156CD|nr:HD family hydrolase [Thermococcus sp.]
MGFLELFLEAGNLKKLRRTGWILRGVPIPESIADHSFRAALITLFLADELRDGGVEIDTERALRMALLHDLGEARITDVPLPAQRYFDKAGGEEALKGLFDKIEGAGRYMALFEEYSGGSTPEGKLVRFADKLEMLLQAYEYERTGFRGLDEFWKVAEDLRASEFYPYFRDLVEGLVERRKELYYDRTNRDATTPDLKKD